MKTTNCKPHCKSYNFYLFAQNVHIAQVLRDAVLAQCLPIRLENSVQNLAPADFTATDQNPVSTMHFVLLAALFRLCTLFV